MVQKPLHDLKCLGVRRQRVRRKGACRKWLPCQLHAPSGTSPQFPDAVAPAVQIEIRRGNQ